MPKVPLFSSRIQYASGQAPAFKIPIYFAEVDLHDRPFDPKRQTALEAVLDTGFDGEFMTTFPELNAVGFAHHSLWNLVYGKAVGLLGGKTPIPLTPVLDGTGRPVVNPIVTASGPDTYRPHHGYFHLVCDDGPNRYRLFCLNRSTNRIDVKDRMEGSLVGTKILGAGNLDVSVKTTPTAGGYRVRFQIFGNY